jgi:uncharacterized iron-regulated membrane protein
LTVQLRSSWKRVAWTLHSTLGFWFFPFILMWGLTGAYLSFQEGFGAAFDYLEPLDLTSEDERLVDKIQYWLAYLHFGRLGGRGIPGCGRGLCDAATKAIWAAAALAPALLLVTGAVMWWTRVVRPSRRFRSTTNRAPSIRSSM